MKRSTKFTPEYKQMLLSNIDDITRYLENKTSYHIEMSVKHDKKYGYLYYVKISTDINFSKYTKFTLHSTGKQKIKDELLEKITQQADSSTSRITCCSCGNEVKTNNEIFCNKHSVLFKRRQGYVFLCRDCAIQQFTKILCERNNIYMAFWWICGCYDRRFSRSIVDKVKELPLSPSAKCIEYFKRLNLEKGKGILFVDSDVVEDIEKKDKVII